MSRAVANLLDQPEQLIKRAVAILEDKNGYPSHDVRHLATNIQKVRTKIAKLGLDPDDTTGEELYHALLTKFQADSQSFDVQFSAVGLDFDERNALAAQLMEKQTKLPEVWTLKASAAKALLAKNPPKKLMKHLGYRSATSLLKREKLAEIHLLIGYFESATWTKAYDKKVSSLDSSNFELRAVKIATPRSSKWGEFEDTQAFDSNYGAIGLLPNQQTGNYSVLSLAVLLADILSDFDHINISEKVAGLSPIVAWWSDMDGLLAGLSGGNVSMSVADVAVNNDSGQTFANRQQDSARRSFWRSLTERYENILTAEEDLKMSFDRRVAAIKPINQPAFEYVEEMDI